MCLAGPQFEVQRVELFDRLEYYFTNGKRTPQLLVQVQSSLSTEVPLVIIHYMEMIVLVLMLLFLVLLFPGARIKRKNQSVSYNVL